MAAIKISVQNNLYSISMDQYDWSSLTVNGQPVPLNSGGGYSYTQPSEGPLDFTATATDVSTVNPDPNLFIMKGSSKTHMAVLTYTPTGSSFAMQGLLDNVSPRPDAKAGPFAFNQAMMTGEFVEG